MMYSDGSVISRSFFPLSSLDDDNACDYGILARCIVGHHVIYARCYTLSLLVAAVPSECAASRRAAPHQLSAA